MLFVSPVGGDKIWPIGRGKQWVLAICHIIIMAYTTDWAIWSVGVSNVHQGNYAWALALLSSHMYLELRCVSKG